MKKIGIDIVKIDRFKTWDDKNFKKFLHPKELEYLLLLENDQRKIEFIAGRWAAKEAIFKAVNHKIAFNQIWIDSVNKKPEVHCDFLPKIELSISHDGEYAIAMVNIE